MGICGCCQSDQGGYYYLLLTSFIRHCKEIMGFPNANDKTFLWLLISWYLASYGHCTNNVDNRKVCTCFGRFMTHR